MMIARKTTTHDNIYFFLFLFLSTGPFLHNTQALLDVVPGSASRDLSHKTTVTTEEPVLNISDYYHDYLARGSFLDKVYNGTVNSETSALILVDLQNDFIGEWQYEDATHSPCAEFQNSIGAPNTTSCFGVQEGDAAALVVASMLNNHTWGLVIASEDDHSPNHCTLITPPITIH